MLAWLEDGLRETRGQLLRVEQGLSAVDGRVGELTGKIHAAEDAAAAVARRFTEIAQIGPQVAQLRHNLTQIEEQAQDAERRQAEALRVQQQESERQRQELNGAIRRVDQIERAVSGFSQRFENIETTLGRIQEALTLARQRTEEVARRQEDADVYVARSTEAFKRYDNALGVLGTDVQDLKQGGTQIAQRVQAFGESVKRLEERIDATAAEVTAQREIFERIDLLRAELHRLQDRIAAAEATREGDRGEIDESQRLIGLLDGKQYGFNDRLAMLQQELIEYRELMAEQFNRLHLTLDRQKRHQIEELQRELRDLQVNAFRPAEELIPDD